MFINYTHLIQHNPAQLNYGIAIVDVDCDGRFEAVVTGFGFPNLVLKWNGSHLVNIASPPLADASRMAIGVAAGDIDGDGREEIYIMNADTFMGQKRVADRLFDGVGDEWIDLFALEDNQAELNLTAGRSVVCVDRLGQGQYGFYVANYGGYARFYELDDDGFLRDRAFEIGVDLVTGGRAAIALPLIADNLSGGMDIFAANERGANFLFRHQANGRYREEAMERDVGDRLEHGRGVAVLDNTATGCFDLVCGNWEGPHRLFVQKPDGSFQNEAPPSMAAPSRIRTVIVADFDNDGYQELFFNNIGQPNRLFRQVGGQWQRLEMGDALEPLGLGTGAAVADFDGDGQLELLIAHGESMGQPLSFYRAEARPRSSLVAHLATNKARCTGPGSYRAHRR
jgi:hypothetical protein